MQNAFDYFDKIYCINLDSRPDRWQEAKGEFEALSISSYERVSGVVASSGALGCAKAICNVAEKALSEGREAVLICEDDLYFPKGKEHTHSKLQAALAQLPADWDALYLGATLIDRFHARPVEAYSSDLLKLNSAFATHTIAYSRKGLQTLMQEVSAIPGHVNGIITRYEAIDVYLAKEYLHKNNCFITNELLSFQRPSYSDICNNYQNYLRLMQDAFNQFAAV
jgi:GR25 family glycosyltransferase involved in LPS biosynthesis